MKSKEGKRITGLVMMTAAVGIIFALSGSTAARVSAAENTAKQPLTEEQNLVKNLFDEDVREQSPLPGIIPNDYPMKGRSIFGEVKVYF